ncbi:MAG: FG-GAP repeat protein [Bacteroidota bacterium]
MKRLFLNACIICMIGLVANAQVAISIDGSAAGKNSMLDIKSVNKGVVFPRLTSIQRKAIKVTEADAGLMLFDTDKQALYMFNGNEWMPFAFATSEVGLLNKRVPPNAQSGNFGYACAVSGNYAVVGAYNDSVGTTLYQGSAYVFKKTNGNWILQTRLIANDGLSSDLFGIAVGIYEDHIAIGASNARNGNSISAGAVYIFKRTEESWNLEAKVFASDGAVNYKFGISLGLHGNFLLIGSPAAKVGTNVEQGAAYVFYRSGATWYEQKKLIANDGSANARFGNSVALNYTDFIVGGTGVAYVFTKALNIYYQEGKLIPTGSVYASFGCSVSISGNKAVVGAYTQPDGSNNSGVIHLFNRTGTTWTYGSNINAFTSKSDLRFGLTVLIKGDYIFAAASQEDIGDFDLQGSVYLYKWNGSYFEYFKRITDPNGTIADRFGNGIGFDGNSFVIGAAYGSRNAGSVLRGSVFFGSVE